MDDSVSLREARDWLRERVDDGETCPCCTQRAQVYTWNLYSTAARALIFYYRLGGTTEFVHTSRLKEFKHYGQGDASRLRRWNLVVEEKTRRPDGGRSGYWLVTDEGEKFVKMQTTIPKYVRIYNNRVLGFSGPQISIVDALGTKFDYSELMSR